MPNFERTVLAIPGGQIGSDSLPQWEFLTTRSGPGACDVAVQVDRPSGTRTRQTFQLNVAGPTGATIDGRGWPDDLIHPQGRLALLQTGAEATILVQFTGVFAPPSKDPGYRKPMLLDCVVGAFTR